ncbi:hypothetical protein EVAR_18188_1 [Eumeta japonica]|uniref:Uncharacterized protein n=1 Tax=Eumeta variegata TaxID=151549 RepID=A0A4C1UVS5_EUMVA|nr:hypothetical protein EVAR_18188_1 [Eumeta japonica]
MATAEDNISPVRLMIETDKSVTYLKIPTSIGFDDESWIYYYEPETKRQSAQLVFSLEELPTKVKWDQRIRKKMVASFF